MAKLALKLMVELLEERYRGVSDRQRSLRQKENDEDADEEETAQTESIDRYELGYAEGQALELRSQINLLKMVLDELSKEAARG